MFLVGAPALSWSAVSAPAPEPRWGTFLTVLLWNTCGYDSAGTLAAEVAEPVRNYLRFGLPNVTIKGVGCRKQGKVYMPAMLLCILLSTLLYLGPILVGVSAEGTQIDNWVDGYWTDVAEAIGGRWLAGWVSLAGAMSTAGLLNTLLCTTSRALAAMGQRGLMPEIVGRLHPRYMTPHVAIGVMTCAIAALMLSDFETLIAANMMTYILKLVLECAYC
jgi:amino acid transporter